MTVPQSSVTWRKSTRSQTQGACVELANTGAVRDSKNPAGPVLGLPWAGLVAAVKTDQITR